MFDFIITRRQFIRYQFELLKRQAKQLVIFSDSSSLLGKEKIKSEENKLRGGQKLHF
jgi:hypothetical protein